MDIFAEHVLCAPVEILEERKIKFIENEITQMKIIDNRNRKETA